MPPRPPPSPPLLTVLCALSTLVSGWLALALEQSVRGLVGAWLGVPWHGLALDPERGFTAIAVQGAAAGEPALAAGLPLLAGSAAVIVAALLVYHGVGLLRASGWLRGFALGSATVGLLWVPTALAAAALPGGTGPVAELYGRLGEPQAGRWASGALALVTLALLAAPAARRAVATGGRWMRADSLQFRRRLVRVVAGYPGALAMALLCAAAGWARTPAAAVWVVAVFGAVQLRTR